MFCVFFKFLGNIVMDNKLSTLKAVFSDVSYFTFAEKHGKANNHNTFEKSFCSLITHHKLFRN